MEIRVDGDETSLSVAFPAREGLQSFLSEVAEHRAFLLKLDRQLPLRSRWRVQFEAPGVRLVWGAEVVQLFDTATAQVATAFEIVDWSEERGEELRRVLAGPPPGGAPGAAGEGGPGEIDTTEMSGISPLHRIRELNPTQRALLAMKAGRAERRILVRDGSPHVLQALLANPRLEGKEVLGLVQSTHATAAILQRVAGDGRWGKNQEILTAVARNPKTPSPLAVRLMEKLRTPDLRRMAKMSGGLRENVRRAALREYLRRTQAR